MTMLATSSLAHVGGWLLTSGSCWHSLILFSLCLLLSALLLSLLPTNLNWSRHTVSKCRYNLHKQQPRSCCVMQTNPISFKPMCFHFMSCHFVDMFVKVIHRWRTPQISKATPKKRLAGLHATLHRRLKDFKVIIVVLLVMSLSFINIWETLSVNINTCTKV